jgi:hypothetical protein
MNRPKGRTAATTGTFVGVALVIIVAIAAVGYFALVPGGQISSLQSQVSSLQSQNAAVDRNWFLYRIKLRHRATRRLG